DERAVEARRRERLLEAPLHDREMRAELARERVLERLGRSELAAAGERAGCRAGRIQAKRPKSIEVGNNRRPVRGAPTWLPARGAGSQADNLECTEPRNVLSQRAPS